jgi:hypothetical protein
MAMLNSQRAYLQTNLANELGHFGVTMACTHRSRSLSSCLTEMIRSAMCVSSRKHDWLILQENLHLRL